MIEVSGNAIAVHKLLMMVINPNLKPNLKDVMGYQLVLC